jgi:hypothetical protein
LAGQAEFDARALGLALPALVNPVVAARWSLTLRPAS